MSCDIGMALNGVLISSTYCFVKKKSFVFAHASLSYFQLSNHVLFVVCLLTRFVCLSLYKFFLHISFTFFFALFSNCTCLILAHRKYLIQFFLQVFVTFLSSNLKKKVGFFYVSFLELFQNFILVFCHVALEDCLPLSKLFQMFLPIVICCATPSFCDFAFVLLHNIELCMPPTFFPLLSKISTLPFFSFFKCCKHQNFVVWNQEVLKLYGSSLEVLWSKFCDKSYMVKALCCLGFVV